MNDHHDGWPEIGEQIRRRMLERRWKQKDLVSATALSRETIGPMVRGEPGNYRPSTLAEVCVALGWPADAIERVLMGDMPAATLGRLNRSDEPAVAEDPADRIDQTIERIEMLERRLSAVQDLVAALFVERLPDGVDVEVAPPEMRQADLVISHGGQPTVLVDLAREPTKDDVDRMADLAEQLGGDVAAVVVTTNYDLVLDDAVAAVARARNVGVVGLAQIHGDGLAAALGSLARRTDIGPPADVDRVVHLVGGDDPAEERKAARSGRTGKAPATSSHRPTQVPEDPETP